MWFWVFFFVFCWLFSPLARGLQRANVAGIASLRRYVWFSQCVFCPVPASTRAWTWSCPAWSCWRRWVWNPAMERTTRCWRRDRTWGRRSLTSWRKGRPPSASSATPTPSTASRARPPSTPARRWVFHPKITFEKHVSCFLRRWWQRKSFKLECVNDLLQNSAPATYSRVLTGLPLDCFPKTKVSVQDASINEPGGADAVKGSNVL